MNIASVINILDLVIILSLTQSMCQDELEYIDFRSSEDAPFVAIVMCTNNKYFCTGTIIEESWVLTAAHCLYDASGELTENDTSVRVIAGCGQPNAAELEIHKGLAQVRESERVIPQEIYTFDASFINDLALIKLKTPFHLTARVRKVPFGGVQLKPRSRKLWIFGSARITKEDDLECVVYGYGKVYKFIDDINDYSLKSRDYYVDKKCNILKGIRAERRPSLLGKKHIFLCEYDFTFGGVCFGDNGGPLLCGGYLRGITTTIFNYERGFDCEPPERKGECGTERTAGVFTDICLFSSWIHIYIPGFPNTDDKCKPIV